MFTGIVTAVGTVEDVRDAEGLRTLSVHCDASFLEGAGVGDSIAVDGACLTPVAVEEDGFIVELVASTLARTVAGGYVPGHRVNLERAMVVGGRFDGHVVQGHVDGIATLIGLREEGGTRYLDFALPDEVWALTLLHGSITLNGISLTVNALEPPDRCQVAIIPHTWNQTNLSALRPGDGVNVEGDVMGKYVKRILDPYRPGPEG